MNFVICFIVDIDECADGTHTCTALQQCLNIAGGFECINISKSAYLILQVIKVYLY